MYIIVFTYIYINMYVFHLYYSIFRTIPLFLHYRPPPPPDI